MNPLGNAITDQREADEKRRAEKRAERARKYPVSGGVSTRVEPREVNVISGTFVHEKETAERMLAGSQRHLNALGETQVKLRVQGIKMTPNKLRGAVRKARRDERRKAFRGSEGFEFTARMTHRGAGPQGKAKERADARARAAEFNAKFGVTPPQ